MEVMHFLTPRPAKTPSAAAVRLSAEDVRLARRARIRHSSRHSGEDLDSLEPGPVAETGPDQNRTSGFSTLLSPLVEPSFARRAARRPPARPVGMLLLVLGAGGLLVAIVSVLADLAFSPGVALSHGGVHLVAAIAGGLGIVGGLRLVSRREDGRAPAVAGLLLNLLGVVLEPTHLLGTWTILELATWSVLYFAIVTCRTDGVDGVAATEREGTGALS